MFKKNYVIYTSSQWSDEDVVTFVDVLKEFGAIVKMTDISNREELPESDNGVIVVFKTTRKRFNGMIKRLNELGHSKPSRVGNYYVF